MAIVGSSVVVGKLVVARVPVFLVGGLRLAFACAVLVPLLLLVERGRPRLGFLMFLPFAAREAVRFGLARISAWDWVALAYYGLVVTVLAFVLWARGLAVVPASTAAVFTAVLPLSAVLLSYAVLGEAFAWSHVLGAACVIGEIVLLAREPAGAA